MSRAERSTVAGRSTSRWAATGSTLALVVFGAAWSACEEGPEGDADAGPDLDRVTNCGAPGSTGNALGVGLFCERDAQCTAVESPLQLHCSTVLVDSALPLLCSSSCEPGVTDCGPNAACRDIAPIGYDLIVCVPDACERDYPAVFVDPEPPEDAGTADAGADAGD